MQALMMTQQSVVTQAAQGLENQVAARMERINKQLADLLAQNEKLQKSLIETQTNNETLKTAHSVEVQTLSNQVRALEEKNISAEIQKNNWQSRAIAAEAIVEQKENWRPVGIGAFKAMGYC